MRSASLVVLLLGLLLLPSTSSTLRGQEDREAKREKRLRLADALEAQGDDEGALKILQELAEAEKDNPGAPLADLHKRIAVILIQAERFEEAIPHLREALEIQGGEEADYGALARMMIELRLYDQAVGLLESGARRYPQSPLFPFLLTYALNGQERWQESLAQFSRTLETAPDQAPELIDEYFHYRHGITYERLGKLEEATQHLKAALEQIRSRAPQDQSPEFTATVLNYVAYMWIERGERLEEFGPLALQAAELAPDSGAIADTVGWYYFQKGDYPRALSHLKKAERLMGDPDPEIYNHLGQTLAKLKEKPFAAEYFRKAIELDPENPALKARLAEVETPDR